MPRTTTLSGKTRSPGVARYLMIKWTETSLPTQNEEGYSRTVPLRTLVEVAATGKPALIYFANDEADDKEVIKIERKLFAKDAIAIGSQYFDCFKIDGSTLTAEERARYAPKLPSFAILDTDGKLVATIAGRKGRAGLLRAMSGAYKSVYGRSLTRDSRKFEKFLNVYEKAEDRVAALKLRRDGLAKRLAKKDKAKTRKDLAEVEEQMTKAQAVLAKLDSDRDALLKAPARVVVKR